MPVMGIITSMQLKLTPFLVQNKVKYCYKNRRNIAIKTYSTLIPYDFCCTFLTEIIRCRKCILCPLKSKTQ